MSAKPVEWDTAGFTKALKSYLDLKKNVDPKKELRRRAKNVGIRLVKIYKDKGVNLEDISQFAIGDNIRIRPKIREAFYGKNKILKRGKKKGQQGGMYSYQDMINAELRARRSAKGFTSTGWFPSIKKLGGNPRRLKRAGTGPERGGLIEKLGSGEMSETLVNQQPGAATVQDKAQSYEQQALDAETADMVTYIVKKQNESARKAGL